jgi:hypothetical protein
LVLLLFVPREFFNDKVASSPALSAYVLELPAFAFWVGVTVLLSGAGCGYLFPRPRYHALKQLFVLVATLMAFLAIPMIIA